ncbi:hypothetical protein ID866_3141 [Astraeus odoratus]|nr:hypothetical protein ID866_3141 [Astraeus odoratus]
MSEDPYISKKAVDASYRPQSYQMSPGLLRAREPFRVKNAITGLILAAFGVGVWAYSIRAVKQEDFSDVDEEARELMRGRGIQKAAAAPGATPAEPSVTVIPSAVSPSIVVSTPPLSLPSIPDPAAGSAPALPKPRGILASRINPRFLDPTQKTLVWGAPPVESIGRMRLRSSNDNR